MLRSPGTHVLIVAAALALACSSSDESARDPSDSADLGDGSAVAGKFVTHLALTEDSCGQSGEFSAEVVDLEVTDGGNAFHYVSDGIPIDCQRDSASAPYSCNLTFGAPVVATTDFVVSWDGKRRFEGDLSFSFECAKPGALCDQLEAAFPHGLPCTTSGHYVATRALPASFAPTAGDYTLAIGEPLLNTCSKAVEQRPKAPVSLVATDTGFTLQGPGDDEPLACAHAAGGSANCFRQLPGAGRIISHTLVGGWTSETLLEGALSLEFSCEGGESDCLPPEAGLGPLPCKTVYPVTLTPAKSGS